MLHCAPCVVRASHVTLCTVCCNNATFERFPFPPSTHHTHTHHTHTHHCIHTRHLAYTLIHIHWPSCVYTQVSVRYRRALYVPTLVRALTLYHYLCCQNNYYVITLCCRINILYWGILCYETPCIMVHSDECV